MTNSEIFDEIREELGGVSATKVSNTYLLTGLNIHDGELVSMALNSSPDHNFKVGESYTDLISTSGLVDGNVGFNGEYPFPSDLIKPLRFELSFDGTTFREASIYDIASSLAESEHNQTQIQSDFNENNPYVRFERDSYFIRPIKTTSGNITSGIHIWYEKRQTAFAIGAISTDTPSIEANFHRLYVVKGALRAMRKFRNDYTLQDRQELRREQEREEQKLDKFMKDRFKRPLRISAKHENFR